MLKKFARALVSPIDRLLDRITSYRLVLYVLFAVVVWSVVASFFDQVPFSGLEIAVSFGWLTLICYYSNLLISRYFNIPSNIESSFITAFILTLILNPPILSPLSSINFNDFVVLAAAGVVAMASKYILVINKWHIFNPAAMGAFVSGAVFNHQASWWVGTDFLLPVVILGGWLVLRKMKRYILATTFITTSLVVIGINAYLNQGMDAVDNNIWLALVSSQLFFFTYIMLTEPLTSPRYIQNYLPYGFLVAVFYSYTKLHISPEEALLLGNIFTYIFEPNKRMVLTMKRRVREANGIQSYVFSGKNKFKYQAGQYMEWTVEGSKSDLRGNRRYLTISSSPTEKELMFTVRMPKDKPSSFKQKLAQFKTGDSVLAGQLSGTFVLPKSERQKLAFLAGGVGITPFRSMVKYTVDFSQERDIHLLYSASSQDDFAFRDLFTEAKGQGLETTYTTDLVDKEKIKETIEDYRERIFYISGPYGFVKAQEKNLLDLEVPSDQIKIDYFPGYG